MSETFERLVEFTPAFDGRDPDPSKNYGVHGVEMRMVLKGARGAMQFVVFTNWHLPAVEQDFGEKALYSKLYLPMGADVGYHSPSPLYAGQGQMAECPYLGGPCYYDGSGLAAEEMLEVLIAEGGEAVWKRLEDRYREVFGEGGKDA